MKKILYTVVIFALGGASGFFAGTRVNAQAKAAAATPPPADAKRTLDMSVTDGGLYRVRKVIDGDSVILENGLRVCYHGVRAPETGHFVKDAAPLGAEAANRNAELVEGKEVRLKLAREPFDIHGRILASLLIQSSDPAVPEIDAGQLLVKEGLARAFGMGLSHDEYEAMKKLELQAKSAKSGIWGLEDKLRGADASSKPYCAASGSTLYHLSTCSTAKRIHPENRHEYATIEEAEESGLNPCRRCVPK
jgi:endonuclease YncB( thermonuclease family)